MILLFVIDILPRELIPPRYYRITGNLLVLTMCQGMLELYLWLFGVTIFFLSVRAQESGRNFMNTAATSLCVFYLPDSRQLCKSKVLKFRKLLKSVGLVPLRALLLNDKVDKPVAFRIHDGIVPNNKLSSNFIV
jgi:hypothetical protein